jgi:exopolysaccharide biosynthesis protein
VGDYYPTFWSPEDRIVANGIPSTSITIGEDKSAATFDFGGEEIASPFHVIYPYTEGSFCIASRPTVVFKAEQHYTEKSFDAGHAPMYGYSNGNGSVSLKHLTGVLHLSIKGATALSKIEITTSANKALAGEFDINCQNGALTPINNRTYRKVTYFAEVPLSTTTAKDLYITLPAGEYGDGTLIVTNKEGEMMTLYWYGAKVKSGVVHEFNTFTFKRNTALALEGMEIEGGDLVIETPDGPEVVGPGDPDSLAFVLAKRKKLEISNAEGYVISTELFDSAQNISVVKLSPEKFSIKGVLPTKLTRVSDIAISLGANYALNACYWDTSTGLANTMIKVDGIIHSQTSASLNPRVNGLLFFYDDHIEIMESYAYPYFSGVIEGCDNVFSCGPMLIDEGAVIQYDEFLSQTDAPSNIASMITFFKKRHPRTIIGKDDKNSVFFVVVDGRSTGNAEGMSIQELQKICSWMGLTDAMNLDGGGSSTLWSNELGIINYPCDNGKFDHAGERKVLTSIIATQK